MVIQCVWGWRDCRAWIIYLERGIWRCRSGESHKGLALFIREFGHSGWSADPASSCSSARNILISLCDSPYQPHPLWSCLGQSIHRTVNTTFPDDHLRLLSSGYHYLEMDLQPDESHQSHASENAKLAASRIRHGGYWMTHRWMENVLINFGVFELLYIKSLWFLCAHSFNCNKNYVVVVGHSNTIYLSTLCTAVMDIRISIPHYITYAYLYVLQLLLVTLDSAF